MLLIKVTEQYARKYNDATLITDNINSIPITFEFDESWTGLDLTYQFKNGDVTIDLATNDLIVNIPHEVLITGTVSVVVSGSSLDVETNTVTVKATTNPLTYNVIASTLVQTDTRPVTPTLYDQLRQIAEDAKVKVTLIEGETSNLVNLKQNMIDSTEAALLSEQNAKASEDASLLSQQQAKASQDAAKLSEDNAAAKVVLAQDQVTLATNQAVIAGQKSTIATDKATIATNKAAEAAASALQAQETFSGVYSNTTSISSIAPIDKNLWLDLNVL